MGSDWSAPDVIAWKEEALQAQQEYHISLSDRTWDRFYESELEYLRSKICFAVYRCPEEYEDTDEELPGYTDEQKAKTSEICDKIVELSFRHIDNEGVLVAIVFVCIKIWEKKFTLPVFRICTDTDGSEDEVSYVDSAGTVYKDWNEYLITNVLPKCMYCYPTNGFYCDKESDDDNELGKVDVSYGTSPACDLGNIVKTVFDISGTVGSSFSAGILIASFFSPVGPILAGTSAVVGVSSAVYGGYRSTEVLVDRSKHDQSISLSDPEARAAWISLVGSLLGITAGSATKAMVVSSRSGNVLNMAGRIAVTVANFGSLTVNGIGIANSLAHLMDKMAYNELKPLDLYQFTLSVLFFTNGVMNMKTASTIIKETQNEVIAGIRAKLRTENEKVAFDKLAADTRDKRQMHGNGRVIKNLLKIDNLRQFMTALVQASGQEEHEVMLTADGMISINKQLKIHADAFTEMSEVNQARAMRATRAFAANNDQAQFLDAISEGCRAERIKFELQRERIVGSLAAALEVPDIGQITIGGKELFKDLRPFEKDRLYDVMTAGGNEIDSRMAKAALTLAKMQKCEMAAEYCSLFEFVARHVAKLRQNTRLERNQTWAQWKSSLLSDLQNSISSKFLAMNATFNELEATLTPINEASRRQFKCTKALTYHFYKHNAFQQGVVNEQQYFEIMNELFVPDLDSRPGRLTQEGDRVRITVIETRRGLFGILIRPRHISGNSGVFVATMYYDSRLTRLVQN